jgi:hypothetical protein
MPLAKHVRWSVYVWDFLERAVIVLDPYMQGYHESKLRLEHAGYYFVLQHTDWSIRNALCLVF